MMLINLVKTKTHQNMRCPTFKPDICHIWYPTALFGPVKKTQKVRKFSTNQPKVRWLEKSTLPTLLAEYIGKYAPLAN